MELVGNSTAILKFDKIWTFDEQQICSLSVQNVKQTTRISLWRTSGIESESVKFKTAAKIQIFEFHENWNTFDTKFYGDIELGQFWLR